MLGSPESSQDVLRLQPLGRRLDARGSYTSTVTVPITMEAVSLAAQSYHAQLHANVILNYRGRKLVVTGIFSLGIFVVSDFRRLICASRAFLR